MERDDLFDDHDKDTSLDKAKQDGQDDASKSDDSTKKDDASKTDDDKKDDSKKDDSSAASDDSKKDDQSKDDSKDDSKKDDAKDEEAKDEPKFDADGNVVDDAGKIIQSKEDYETEQEILFNTQVLDETKGVMGIKVLNPDGTEKKYEPTTDGLNQYLADAVQVSKNIGISEFVKTLPQDVQEFMQFRAKGGNPADFFKDAVDYSKVNVAALAEDQKMNLLIDFHQSNGMSKEAAQKNAKRAQDAKALDEDVKEALTVLQNRQVEAKAEMDRKLDADNKAFEAKVEAHWNGVKKTVLEVGKLGDFVIPATDRQKFFDYISIDVDGKGHSQAAIDAMNRPPELAMLIDYLYGFGKQDVKSIVAKLTGMTKVEGIRSMRRMNSTGSGKKNNDTPVVNDNKLPTDRDILFTGVGN